MGPHMSFKVARMLELFLTIYKWTVH